MFKGPRLSSRVFCSLYFNDCIPGVSFNMFSCFLSFLQTVANARGLNTPIFIHVLHYSPLTLLGGPPRRPQPASRHFSQELVVVVVGQCVSGWIILGITGKFQTKACGKSQQNWVLKDIFFETAILDSSQTPYCLASWGSIPPYEVLGPWLVLQTRHGVSAVGSEITVCCLWCLYAFSPLVLAACLLRSTYFELALEQFNSS